MPDTTAHPNHSLLLIALLFIGAGAMHFIAPRPYLGIMPPVLPHPLALVYISGVFEMLGGIGVLVPFARRFSGWGLILLLLAVFPANIYMFTHELSVHGWTGFALIGLLRLPLQLALIWWVWRAVLVKDHAEA